MFFLCGKTYLPPVNKPAFQNHIHGPLNRAAFYAAKQDRTHAVGMPENHGENLPLSFRITVRCRLTEAAIFQSFCVEHIGETAMPLAFRLHTTFIEPNFFRFPSGTIGNRIAGIFPRESCSRRGPNCRDLMAKAGVRGKDIAALAMGAMLSGDSAPAVDPGNCTLWPMSISHASRNQGPLRHRGVCAPHGGGDRSFHRYGGRGGRRRTAMEVYATGGANPETIPKFPEQGIAAVGTGVAIVDKKLLEQDHYAWIAALARKRLNVIRAL